MPGRSCVKGTLVKERPMVHWPHFHMYDVHKYVPESEIKFKRPYPKSHRILCPDQRAVRDEIRQNNILRQGEYITEALARARGLANLLGFSVEGGWPVAWVGDKCYIHHPPTDGLIDEAFLIRRSNWEG